MGFFAQSVIVAPRPPLLIFPSLYFIDFLILQIGFKMRDVVLIQKKDSKRSDPMHCIAEFDFVAELCRSTVEAFCAQEGFGRRSFHRLKSITREQLFDFVEDFDVFECLVYQRVANMYLPHDRKWIAERTLMWIRDEEDSMEF